MPLPRVAVLFNEPTLPADHPDAESEHDILYTADCVAKAVGEAGLPVARVGAGADPAAVLAGLSAAAPDVVFNLYEGTAGWGNTEAFVAGLLELLRVPFTGSPAQPLMLCRSKPLTKRLLAGAGLPTAPFFVVDPGPVPPCPVPWPVIVKPGAEDASVGIDQASVVTSQAQLDDRVEYLRAAYGPSVLVERFVVGREFNVALVEGPGGAVTALPFSEILFVPPADAPGLWPLVTFDAKWRPGTRDFVATPAKNPADVAPALRDRVARLAEQAFRLAGCRDYARVDFRVAADGTPYILEVNPNPCISPVAGLAAGLESAGVPWPEFVLDLVRAALRRAGPGFQVPKLQVPSREPAGDSAAWHAGTSELGAFKARPARRADAEAVAGLDPAAGRRVARPARDGWRCLVRVGPAGVVGAAGFGPADAAHGAFAVDTLAVAPAHRRAGHGAALLRAVEAAVGAAGGRTLVAWVSSAAGAAAGRQLLARAGFRPAGEVPDYYKDGTARLLYSKPIPAPAAPAAGAGAAART